MARYYSNHVYREELEHRACTESELLNELREFDFRDSELTQAETAHVSRAFDVARAIFSKSEHSVRGRMTLKSGQTHEFSDLRDTDDLVGRHLPIYLHDRTMHLPFSWIRTVSIAEDLRMFFFDDLWVPAEVTLRPGGPLQYVRARIPARYPGWSDADVSVRDGQVTMFNRDHGYRRARGLRDYEMVVDTITSLVGVLQLRHIEFFTGAQPELPRLLGDVKGLAP